MPYQSLNTLLFRWILQGFVLCLLVFLVQKYMPMDAAEVLLQRQGVENNGSERYQKLYSEARVNLGLDGPVFYFGLEARDMGNWHVPGISWNGKDNQFHNWLSRFFKKDGSVSLISGQKTSTLIKKGLSWTIPTSLLALCLIYYISKFLGIYLKSHKSKIIEGLMFFFYSVPMIWLALLIMLFFTNSHFGVEIFDSSPIIGEPGFLDRLNRILPAVLCLAFTDIAYLTSVYGTSIDLENKKPYFRTALAKGLSYEMATKQHSAPNALLSMVTLFIGAIPASLAGSVILETIFNIPGLGRLLFNSIRQGDFPVIIHLVLIIGLATSFFYAVGDYFISRINPEARKEVSR